MKLRFKLFLPLVAQVRWAKDAQPLGIATVEQFASDQRSFDPSPAFDDKS
jgi:hypothetical protein